MNAFNFKDFPALTFVFLLAMVLVVVRFVTSRKNKIFSLVLTIKSNEQITVVVAEAVS